MLADSGTTLLQTLAQLPFVQRIWLFGQRVSGSRSAVNRLSIAIDCPAARHLEWQQIQRIVANCPGIGCPGIECVRWDTLDASAPLRRRILLERVLVHGTEFA